jgi:prepilin-type N-terminal cleavage/methylation domain-containing protein
MLKLSLMQRVIERVFPKQNEGATAGFTIVEILIVILIIGLLAGIVLLAYNGVQNNAYETSVKNDLTSAAKALGLYRAKDDEEKFPKDVTELRDMRTDGKYLIKTSVDAYYKTSNNFAYCYMSPAGDSYALVARTKTDKIFYISTISGGIQELTGGWQNSTTDLCPAVGFGTPGNGTGTWGFSGSPRTWQSWVAN